MVALEQASLGSGRITILESVQKTCGYGTQGCGLVVNMAANGRTQQSQGSFPALMIL